MMDAATRAAYDASRNLPSKPFRAACYAPFTSLMFNTLGDVVVCCRSQSYVMGNVGKQRLDEIWSGPRITAMRKAMLDYRFGPGCEFCSWMIDAGDYEGAMARHFDHIPVESPTPAFPSQIEFALGNECNFACIHCCGNWSSRIRMHREGMPPLAKVYDDVFFSDLRRYLPHLKHATFLGGEPFLAPETNRVWELLSELGVRPVSNIITNGSVWNARVERVLEQLKPSVVVSLDAIADPALLERIRVGSKYDVVTGNIRRFRDWSRSNSRRLSLSFSLMRQNWTELGPMLLYAEENDLEINVIRVYDPPQFSLFSLPPDEMLRIADALDARTKEIRPRLRRLHASWDSLIHSLRENARQRGVEGYRHVQEMTHKLGRDAFTKMADAFHRGDMAATLRLGAEVEKTHKDYVHALLLIAHAHRRLEDLAAADSALAEAAAMTSRLASLFIERAWLRIAQGRQAEAIDDARRALDLAKNDDAGRQQRGYAHHALVQALSDVGAADATLQATEEWCALADGDADVLRRCSDYLSKVGQHDAARERASQAAAQTTRVGA